MTRHEFTGKKRHGTLGPAQDKELRRICHIIAGEAFGMSQLDVIGLGAVETSYEYTKTKREHTDLITPLVTLIRNLQQQKTMQLRRIMNSELQKELELRNGKVLEIIDARLENPEDEDKQWAAATELLKRAAPIKTIQKVEGEVDHKVYHIPVLAAQRMAQIAGLREQAAIEAEVVDEEATQ